MTVIWKLIAYSPVYLSFEKIPIIFKVWKSWKNDLHIFYCFNNKRTLAFLSPEIFENFNSIAIYCKISQFIEICTFLYLITFYVLATLCDCNAYILTCSLGSPTFNYPFHCITVHFTICIHYFWNASLPFWNVYITFLKKYLDTKL